MTIVCLCILGLATIVCIATAVEDFKENSGSSIGMKIYAILGVVAGLLMVIGGFISYFTHWF